MRILFASQLLPFPLDAGPKLRAHYVLRHLVEAGHEVTLVSFVRPSDSREDVEALERFCRTVELVPLRRSRLRDIRDGLRSLVGNTPFLILRDRVAAMDHRLTSLIAQRSFDALHADQLWMAPAVVACEWTGTRVLDQHNAVFRVPHQLSRQRRNPMERMALALETRKMQAFERDTIERFSHVVWVNRDDRDALCQPSAMANDGRHRVIPIAIDPTARQPLERRSPFRVTFLGGLHWPPNSEAVRWFVEQVWPRVATDVPRCVFTVVGHRPPGWIRNLAKDPRIEVTGYVPQIEPYLDETAVFVVPLQSGAGMRVKILDAWCHALPVVSTDIGAEGIQVVDEVNGLLANDPALFAEHVVRLMQDPVFARRLAANGRDTAESCYDWRQVYRAWDRIYH